MEDQPQGNQEHQEHQEPLEAEAELEVGLENASVSAPPEFAGFVTPQSQALAAEVAELARRDVIAAWAPLAGHAIALAANLDDPEDNAGKLAQVFSAVHTLNPDAANALALQMLTDKAITDADGRSVMGLVLVALWEGDANLAGQWETMLSIAQEFPHAYGTHIQTIALKHPDVAARQLWSTLSEDTQGTDITQIAQLLADMDVRIAATVLLAAATQGNSWEATQILAYNMSLTDAAPILEHMATANIDITVRLLTYLTKVDPQRTAKVLEPVVVTDLSTAVELLTGINQHVYENRHTIFGAMDPAIADALAIALARTDVHTAASLLVSLAATDRQRVSNLLEAAAAAEPAIAARLLTAMNKRSRAATVTVLEAMDPAIVAEMRARQ